MQRPCFGNDQTNMLLTPPRRKNGRGAGRAQNGLAVIAIEAVPGNISRNGHELKPDFGDLAARILSQW
jgi:hypothetical protein